MRRVPDLFAGDLLRQARIHGARASCAVMRACPAMSMKVQKAVSALNRGPPHSKCGRSDRTPRSPSGSSAASAAVTAALSASAGAQARADAEVMRRRLAVLFLPVGRCRRRNAADC